MARTAMLGVLVATLGLPWSPANATVAADPTLSRTTILSAPAGGSYTNVRLAQSIPFTTLEPGADSMIVHGSAGLVAVVLRSAVPPVGGGLSPGLAITKMPLAVGGDVTYLPLGDDPATGQAVIMQHRLLAGQYRLYVVASASVSIDLQLTGLVSKPVRISVRKRTPVYTAEVPVGKLGGAFLPSSTHGEVYNLRQSSFLFKADVLEVAAQAAHRSGGCLYKGRPPGDRFSPGCVGGSSVGVIGVTVYPTPQREISFGAVEQIPPGTWGWGSSYDVAGAITDAHAYSMWLQF